jgi:hypothetical protein
MKYRKLRIAWSAAWGVVAVLLCVVWVGSYWRHDILRFPIPGVPPLGSPKLKSRLIRQYDIRSHNGVVYWSASGIGKGWQWKSYKITEGQVGFMDGTGKPLKSYAGFRFKIYSAATNTRPSRFVVSVPYYFLALAVSALAAAPWIHWIRWPRRFSLRTLLIATTLVAVALGLVVWASR